MDYAITSFSLHYYKVKDPLQILFKEPSVLERKYQEKVYFFVSYLDHSDISFIGPEGNPYTLLRFFPWIKTNKF